MKMKKNGLGRGERPKFNCVDPPLLLYRLHNVVLVFQVKQQSSASDNEERSMKDLATENAKMKLTMSSETFKQSQEMYDKGG